ncbi:MAG: hypothetical protein JWO36_6992 [Myxococcales bacterium]|nr:hypothetical protein [Myxococcales bacterium]
MSRFDPTGKVRDPNLEHSVVELPWGVLRGAFGPSDGTAGAGSNVPSALAVLRHAKLYLQFPEEIDDAFLVLERHAIRHGQLYPVAITVLPFLFDLVRRSSPASERITDLIADYTAAAPTLEPQLRERLLEIVIDHGLEIVGWIGKHDRAVAALAIHIPALRDEFVAVVAEADRVAPEVLLALIDIGAAPGRTIDLALAMLDHADAELSRMCAAAFLSRYGDRAPELRTRIDAALPPSAPAALERFVEKLWRPTVDRPVVAPKLYEAEVVFAGEKLVLVRAGERSVTLPWVGAPLQRGDLIKVGITVHGQPKLAVITGSDGSVRVIDF